MIFLLFWLFLLIDDLRHTQDLFFCLQNFLQHMIGIMAGKGLAVCLDENHFCCWTKLFQYIFVADTDKKFSLFESYFFRKIQWKKISALKSFQPNTIPSNSSFFPYILLTLPLNFANFLYQINYIFETHLRDAIEASCDTFFLFSFSHFFFCLFFNLIVWNLAKINVLVVYALNDLLMGVNERLKSVLNWEVLEDWNKRRLLMERKWSYDSKNTRLSE